MSSVFNNEAPRKSQGAVYFSLYRVGNESLTLKAIAERYGIDEEVARRRINNARRKNKPVTEELFK
jgi:hypothetical protein